jgi:hypothetical protein
LRLRRTKEPRQKVAHQALEPEFGSKDGRLGFRGKPKIVRFHERKTSVSRTGAASVNRVSFWNPARVVASFAQTHAGGFRKNTNRVSEGVDVEIDIDLHI